VDGIIELFHNYVDENGKLNLPSYFVDWPTSNSVDEIPGCRAILLYMANSLYRFYSNRGINTASIERLIRKLNKVDIAVESSKQVLGLKYMANGHLSADESSKLIKDGSCGMSTFMSYYILKATAETVSPEVAKDMMCEYYGAMLDKGATTFFEDFDINWIKNSSRIDSLPKNGEKDLHGDFGNYCYQGFRHSLCHGWSSGVIRFLYEYCNKIHE